MSCKVTLRKLNVFMFLLFSFSISNCTGGPEVLTIEHAEVKDEQNQASEGSSSINTLFQSTNTYESSKKVSPDKQHIPNNHGHRQLENTDSNINKKDTQVKVETNNKKENKDIENIINEHKIGHQADGNVHFVEEADTDDLKHAHVSDSHDKSVHTTEIERQSKLMNQNATNTRQTPVKEIQGKIKTQNESLHHQTYKPTQPVGKHTDSSETMPTKVSSTNANTISAGKSDMNFKTSEILSLTTSVVETVEHTDDRKRTEAVKPSANIESSIDKTDQNINNNKNVSTSPVFLRTQSTVSTTPISTLLKIFTNALSLTSNPTQHQKQKNGLTENDLVLMPKRPVEDQEIKEHQNICHSGYSSEAVISGIVGGFILGCGLMMVCFYGKTRCNKYIRGDYRRVPMEYDFELNPRYKTG